MITAGGGQFNVCAAAVTPAGDSVLVSVGKFIYKYSTTTLLRTDRLEGHHGNITAICVSKHTNLVVSTDDLGGIIAWNAQTTKPEHKHILQSYSTIRRAEFGDQSAHLLLSCDKEILLFNIKRGHVDRSFPIVHQYPAQHKQFGAKNQQHTPPSQPCVRIAACSGRCRAFWSCDGGIYGWKEGMSHGLLLAVAERTVTALAATSTGQKLVCGTALGKMYVYDIDDQAWTGRMAPPTVLHWHAHDVGDIVISNDDQFMISGGTEQVLVRWSMSTFQRSYFARLDGTIAYVAPTVHDPALFVIGQTTNSIRVLNFSTMKMVAAVHGVARAPADVDESRTGPRGLRSVLDPATGNLLLPSTFSKVQVYNTLQDRQIEVLEITQRNSVVEPNTTTNTPKPINPHISHLTFTHNGACLVTNDVAPDTQPENPRTNTLQFWRVSGGNRGDSAGASAVLGGSIQLQLLAMQEKPHSGDVYVVEASPAGEVVCTGCSAGEWRVWRPSVREDGEWGWGCDVVVRGDAAVTSAVFSEDGSLLAVAVGGEVVVWDVEANVQLHKLFLPAGGCGGISDLCFIHDSTLIAASIPASTVSLGSLVVWDMATQLPILHDTVDITCMMASRKAPTLTLAIPLSHTHTQPDTSQVTTGKSGSFEQLYGNSSILLCIDVITGSIVDSWLIPRGPVTAIHQLPQRERSDAGEPFVVVTKDREYGVIGLDAHTQTQGTNQATESSIVATPLLQLINGSNKGGDPQQHHKAQVKALNAVQLYSQLNNVLGGPSHVLPKISTLCDDVLDVLLQGGAAS